MVWVAVALLQVVAAQPAAPPAEPEAVVEAGAPEPKMKRVCRKVMDPRTNALSARQTVCKYVPAEDGKVATR